VSASAFWKVFFEVPIPKFSRARYYDGMTKQQVDTLKGVAILQVVVIHLLAIFPEIWWLRSDGRAYTLVIIDQLCRVSIPLFIFLSWYGLNMKYQGKPVPLLAFWQSRVIKLIPLYLVWAVGIWIVMRVVPGWGFNMDIPLYLKILLGQADYHLYFVPLIILLYVSYGFYSYLPKTLRLLGTGVVGLLTIWWYSYLPTFRTQFTWIQPDQIQYLVPLTWFWYAWLGGVAADFHFSHRFVERRVKRLLFVTTFCATVWLLIDAYATIHGPTFVPVLLAMQFTRWPVLVFATSMILFIVSTVGHWGNGKKTLLSQVGLFSFVVFLAHTTLIRLGPAQFVHPVPINGWLFAAFISALLFLLSYKLS